MTEHILTHAQLAVALTRMINDPASVAELNGVGTHEELISEVANLAERFSGGKVTALGNGSVIVDTPPSVNESYRDVWGLMPVESMDSLAAEFQAWSKLHGYIPMSADELLAELLTKDGHEASHVDYLRRFIERWDRAPQ